MWDLFFFQHLHTSKATFSFGVDRFIFIYIRRENLRNVVKCKIFDVSISIQSSSASGLSNLRWQRTCTQKKAPRSAGIGFAPGYLWTSSDKNSSTQCVCVLLQILKDLLSSDHKFHFSTLTRLQRTHDCWVRSDSQLTEDRSRRLGECCSGAEWPCSDRERRLSAGAAARQLRLIKKLNLIISWDSQFANKGF